MSFNKIILLGNLTKAPELRQTQGGTSICTASIAVNECRVDRDGNKTESAVFVDIKAFGRTAENISKYFSKGKPILIEGRLAQESWQDKQTGAFRSKHLAIVDRFDFIGKKDDDAQPQTSRLAPRQTPPQAEEDFDDVPF